MLWWAWCENLQSQRLMHLEFALYFWSWIFLSFFFFFCNWHVCACSCEVHAWRRNKTEQVPLSFPLANYSVFLLPGGGVPVPPLPIHWYYIMAAGGALLLLAVAILVRALCCCRQHLATKKSQLSVAYHSSSQCFQYSNWSSSMATPGVEPVLTVRLDSRDRHRTLCWKEGLSRNRSTRFRLQSQEWWGPKLSLSASPLHLVAVFHLGAIKGVCCWHFTRCCSSTEDSESQWAIYLNTCFRAVERPLAPRNADGPPEMTPAWTEHTGMCGLEGAGSQNCQTAD